jgi:hypothetical protein
MAALPFAKLSASWKQHLHAVPGIIHQHVLVRHAGIAQRGAEVLLVMVEQLRTAPATSTW